MRKVLLGGMVAVGIFVLVFVTPGSAQTANKSNKAAAIPEKSGTVYVADFAIDTGNIVQESRLLNRPRRMHEDPEAKAIKLVELLSSSLTRELQNKSVSAQRLYSGQSIPDKGWLVKGQFVEVDEGNRLRRATVGFGAGATDMQIEVEVFDLAGGSGSPFLVFGTDSKTGKAPGGIITMSPYVMAAKFVLSKRASEKDVRKTARQIAVVLVKYMEESGSSLK